MSQTNYLSTALSLTRELILIDSSDPGAYEQEIGDFIADWFSQRGIFAEKDQVLPGRYNVMAKLEGETDDPALVYICHMDTVTGDRPYVEKDDASYLLKQLSAAQAI